MTTWQQCLNSEPIGDNLIQTTTVFIMEYLKEVGLGLHEPSVESQVKPTPSREENCTNS